jgi:hypothetical protein
MPFLKSTKREIIQDYNALPLYNSISKVKGAKIHMFLERHAKNPAVFYKNFRVWLVMFMVLFRL